MIARSEERIIEQVVNQVTSKVIEANANAMEHLITKTVAAIKCDFDTKLLLLQQHQESLDDTDFELKPVSSVEELERLENDLNDKPFAHQVVSSK